MGHSSRVFLRILAAVLGGYGLTYLFAAALPRVLPTIRTEAILWTSMASFTLYLLLIMHAFAEPKVGRLYLTFLCFGGLLAALLIWIPA